MSKDIELGYATIDMNRQDRTGMQEVIYCGHKTSDQIIGISHAMLDRGAKSILLTRLCEESADRLKASLSDSQTLFYNNVARIGVLDWERCEHPTGNIAVVCAGTSDIAVSEEAAITAEFLGNRVTRISDVGVAGIHRLLNRVEDLEKARVVIVIAGMEGALASVVGGLVSCPVIAVPTSVGYGANFGGLSALLSMLNSCASGVSVVNIDNGFGAAVSASKINQMKTAEN